MRVAFTVFGGAAWTGGLNYLRNLLSAISELPERSIEPILFFAEGTDEGVVSQLAPFLAEPPISVKGWSRSRWRRVLRMLSAIFLQKDIVSERAFKAANIDVVFQHATWYGSRFSFPTVAWIADFQHKHLPQMFSLANRLKREIGYRALAWSATRLMVSSHDAKADCEKYFPRFKGRISVLQFCVAPDPRDLDLSSKIARMKYGLPEKYIYLPNQLWRHKNHLALLEALELLEARDSNVVVVGSGSPKDARNPKYPLAVLDKAATVKGFLFLGLVPYEDIIPLMAGSVGVINPSLFEGWSTTVEEAKANQIPLLLSDICVHREQVQDDVLFFNPRAPESIAASLDYAWGRDSAPRRDQTIWRHAAIERRHLFAVQFGSILNLAMKNCAAKPAPVGG